MKIHVACVGKGRCDWADAAVGDYAKRIRRMVRIDEERLDPERFRGDVDAVRRAESERLLARIDGRDRLVAMDERGDALSSEGFADLLRRARVGSVHRLVFAIGGPYGHDATVRERAHDVVGLSSLVLNHEVARVVLYEQIYRGLSILAGAPYHH